MNYRWFCNFLPPIRRYRGKTSAKISTRVTLPLPVQPLKRSSFCMLAFDCVKGSYRRTHARTRTHTQMRHQGIRNTSAELLDEFCCESELEPDFQPLQRQRVLQKQIID